MDLNKLEDLYDILEVDFGCSIEQIEIEYHRKINFFKKKIMDKGNLTNREKMIVKAIRTSYFVLSNSNLRKKYDLSKIVNDSDEEKKVSKKLDHFQYNELNETNNLKKNENNIDFDKLSDRQFQRYDQSFDVSKDRQLRGSQMEPKYKKG